VKITCRNADPTGWKPLSNRFFEPGLRGIGPALAEEARGRRGFRAVREGVLVIASKARFGPIPLRWSTFCWGSVLRSLRKLGRGGTFALCARDFGDRFQGSLRTDPAPLEYLLLGTGPALAVVARSAGSVLRSLRKLGGGGAFALCARDFGDRFQGSLRTDPAPLEYLLLGINPALAEEALGEEGLSRCARGIFGDRFQGSLRTDPAAAG